MVSFKRRAADELRVALKFDGGVWESLVRWTFAVVVG